MEYDGLALISSSAEGGKRSPSISPASSSVLQNSVTVDTAGSSVCGVRLSSGREEHQLYNDTHEHCEAEAKDRPTPMGLLLLSFSVYFSTCAMLCNSYFQTTPTKIGKEFKQYIGRAKSAILHAMP